ncbi:MAG: inositol 2-dehydrogenase [Pseudomonadota bacterium]
MIRIGILGCGRIGQVHAASIDRLRSRAKLVAVADARPEAAQALAAAHGAQPRETAALIASPDIDAVVIGTPTDTHFDLIHAAAAAGKAIFCEKPIDLDTGRVRGCIATVEAAGVPFMTAFQRRFDPSFALLETRLRAGAIGAVEMVALTSRDPAPPPLDYIRSSGGLFRDMMIHDLDMARFLLAEEPVQVFAAGSCLVDPEIASAGDIDSAAVTLTTASGRICQISNSRRAVYGYDQRVEVHGAAGMLVATNQPENLVEEAGPDGFRRAPNRHFFLERYSEAYLREMEHFIDALESGSPPSPSIEDGLRAQLLADAAARSLREAQPVRLDT